MRTLVVPSERSSKAAKAAAAAAGHATMPSWLKPPFKDVYVITGPLFLPSKEPATPAAFNGETGASRVQRTNFFSVGVLLISCLYSMCDVSLQWCLPLSG